MTHPTTTKLTPAQRDKIIELCKRFNVDLDLLAFGPGIGLPPGWVEGWIGDKIFVGISPEGDSHS